MFSNFNLSRLALSISVSVITVVGSLPMTSPVNAQQAGCARRTAGTRPISSVPASIRNFAQRFAPSNVRLTLLADVETEDGETIYELRGFQPNGCSVEVDVISRPAPLRLDEVETQVPSLAQVPQAIRNAISSRVPGYTPTLIERSRRANGSVVFETEGRRRGQEIEVDAQVLPNGNVTLNIVQST